MKKVNFVTCSVLKNSYRKTMKRINVLIIDKYNELGYRDAMIVKDSISQYDEKKQLTSFLDIDEGQKYYLRNVAWVGNTLYPSEQLNYLLRMKKG